MEKQNAHIPPRLCTSVSQVALSHRIKQCDTAINIALTLLISLIAALGMLGAIMSTRRVCVCLRARLQRSSNRIAKPIEIYLPQRELSSSSDTFYTQRIFCSILQRARSYDKC